MKFTFKQFKGDEQSPKTSDKNLTQEQKRREQVRRAQRTHRERKEAYARSLEEEIVQLRASEAKFMREAKALYTEIGVLKRILTDHGIPLPIIPPEAFQIELIPSVEERVENVFDFTCSNQQAKVKNKQERIYCQRRAISEQDTLASPSERTESTVASPRCLGEADHNLVGIDFVLTLEAPCLGHVDAIHDDHSLASTGHAQMVTASLLHEHPAQPGHRLQSDAVWQVPAIGIERLLELAQSLPVEGELTPVQAWSFIQKHPQYHELDFERLERLKLKLLGHIKCYGFGGVIEQGFFENAIFETFVVGRVF